MWIAIGVGIPLLILAIAVAVGPLLSGSIRFHGWQHRRIEAGRRPIYRLRHRVDCPFCGTRIEAATNADAVAAANAHILSRHGADRDAPVVQDADSPVEATRR